MIAVFQRLNTLEPAAVGAEELTPEELPFLRFDPEAQELFDAWRAALEQQLRAEEDHPVLFSHCAKYRSLMPALALIFHLIDGVDAGRSGPICRTSVQSAHLRDHGRAESIMYPGGIGTSRLDDGADMEVHRFTSPWLRGDD